MSGKTIVSSRSRKNSARRWLYQRTVHNNLPAQQVLMIMGAQRSGTTVFSRIFDDLYFADVFGEFSPLSSDDIVGLRLNTPESVNAKLKKSRANLIVMKPLVESQKANYWLQMIPRSKVIWIYRAPADVASSSVLKFGEKEGGRSQARAFVDTVYASKDWAIWKAENASADTMALVKTFYSDDMDAHDAAALFWYARNILYFEQELAQNEDTLLIKYEDMVRYPFLVISYILNQFGIYELKSKALSDIGTQAVGKGKALCLSPGVDEVCTDLLQRLDQHYQSSPLGAMLAALKVAEA